MGRVRVADPAVRVEDALARIAGDAPAPLRPAVLSALGLGAPAKRLRPRVALLAYEAAGGRAPEEAMRVGLAVELFHAATLLVDDVVDGSDLRRGRPAAHVAHGLRPALLAAGFLTNRAQRLAADDDEAGLLEPGEVRVFRDAVDLVLAAESTALATGPDVEADVWIDIARGKTGALFMAAAEGAARRAGAAEPVARALRRYGMSLGLAFQAADDLLDHVGDPLRTGKPTRADANRAPNLAAILGPDAARAFAVRFGEDAVDSLHGVPACDAREALASLALEAARRDR